MNPNTGHLISLRGAMGAAMPSGYRELPAALQPAARLKLRGAREARVNLRSRSPLANWAAEQRAKKKRRDKIAAQSRRRNRR